MQGVPGHGRMPIDAVDLPGGADQFIEKSRKFVEISPFPLANVVRLT
jgi:hypothetical protein